MSNATNSNGIIQVQGISRVFRTYKKLPGLLGAVKGLFHREYEQTAAVNNISFNIEKADELAFLDLKRHVVGRAGLDIAPFDQPFDRSPQTALLPVGAVGLG